MDKPCQYNGKYPHGWFRRRATLDRDLWHKNWVAVTMSRMGLIMLLDAGGNSVMLLTLVGAVALTYWECKSSEMNWRTTAWWVSFVLLTHVIGYLALRLWTASRGEHKVAA